MTALVECSENPAYFLSENRFQLINLSNKSLINKTKLGKKTFARASMSHYKMLEVHYLILQDVDIKIWSVFVLVNLSSEMIGKESHIKVVVTVISQCFHLISVQQSNQKMPLSFWL